MLPPNNILRDRIARIIGATRFPFIDQTTWDEERRTIVNTSREKNYAIVGPKGEFYPSLVVLNPDGAIREIGEVEMEVTPGLVAKWKLLSEMTGRGSGSRSSLSTSPPARGKGHAICLRITG
jgi:hypothetical protein